jgi:cytochrome P450
MTCFGFTLDEELDPKNIKPPAPDQRDAAAIVYHVEEGLRKFFTPTLGFIFTFLYYTEPKCRDAVRTINGLKDFCKQFIVDYRAGKLQHSLLLQDLVPRIDSKEFSLDDAAMMIAQIFTAGDTSANVLEYTLQQLADHPAVQRMAQEEVDRVTAPERFIELADIDQLPYLWSVIKETLRTRYTLAFGMPRENWAAVKWGKYVFPVGTFFAPPVTATLKDTEIFDPSRHAKQPVIEHNGIPEVEFTFFGGGPRFCPVSVPRV